MLDHLVALVKRVAAEYSRPSPAHGEVPRADAARIAAVREPGDLLEPRDSQTRRERLPVIGGSRGIGEGITRALQRRRPRGVTDGTRPARPRPRRAGDPGRGRKRQPGRLMPRTSRTLALVERITRAGGIALAATWEQGTSGGRPHPEEWRSGSPQPDTAYGVRAVLPGMSLLGGRII
jgi:hypothetical protein